MAEKIFFVFATFVDVVAALWIIGIVFTDRMQAMPKWHTAGLVTGAVGLMWQAVRNVYFLYTGTSMSDNDLPAWFLKDLGYFMIAWHSMWLVITGQLKLNTPTKKGRR